MTNDGIAMALHSRKTTDGGFPAQNWLIPELLTLQRHECKMCLTMVG